MSHSRQTEHYGLPLYDGTDIINPLTDFNNANEAIDEAVYHANQRSAEAQESAEQSAQTVTEYDERVTEAETTANNAGVKADNTQKMIAEEFDPLKEGGYKIGDSVIYNQNLYTFINPHTGAWDAGDVKISTITEAVKGTIAEGEEAIREEVQIALEEIAGQTEKVTATQAMIAPAFEPDKEGGYDAGEVVTFADKLYKFNAHHDGIWTGTDVTKVDVQDELDDVIAHIDAQMVRVPATQAMIAPAFDPDKEGGYDAGEVVTFDDKLYKFNAHHDGIWTGTDVTKADVVSLVDETKILVDALGNKVVDKIMLSEEQFISDSTNSAVHTKIENMLNAIIELFNNKDSNVIDIIIDGVDVRTRSFVTEWSVFDIVINHKTVTSMIVDTQGSSVNNGWFRLHALEYVNGSVAQRYLDIFSTVGSTASALTGNLIIADNAVTDETYTIAYHYLYKV